jgi:hypothetical protein
MRKHPFKETYFHPFSFLPSSILSVATSLFLIFGFFIPTESLAANPTCNNFRSATYRITNNSGSTNFNYGQQIETGLSLNTKIAGNTYNPADIIIMMDRSLSMGWNDAGVITSDNKFVRAKAAMQQFVDVVARSGNPNVRIALGSYYNQAELDQDFTKNLNTIKIAINNLELPEREEGNWGTSIGGGLMTAGAALRNQNFNSQTKRFLIIASDGQQNADPSIGEGLPSVPSDVMIYSIGIGADVDADVMKSIADEGGSKDGLYFPSTSSGLAATFQKIVDQIIGYFLLENLQVEFTRDDTVSTSLATAEPAYSSYNSTSGVIKWNNLGNITNARTENLGLNFNTERVGANISLNMPTVKVNYNIEGKACSDILPLNVVQVVVFDSPSCVSGGWYRDPADDRAPCDTITFVEKDQCGRQRTTRGTLHCPQCSDYVDNDHDLKIDYPRDPGCSNRVDDRELNYNFTFFEF